MKKWAPFLFLQMACAMALSLSTGPVHASFADSFRAFVLEEDTPSQTTSSVSLPVGSQSAACMQCHNGHRASGVVLKHAESGMTYSRQTSTNHPVGMSYSLYASRNPQSYVQPGQLNAGIRLENGQVTCVSCHEVKQTGVQLASSELIPVIDPAPADSNSCTATKNLTTGPSTDKLCMSCHAM